MMGSAVAFTLHLATDDVDQTLAEVYEPASAKINLAFGVLGLLLNLWFLIAEIIEMKGGLIAYLSDI